MSDRIYFAYSTVLLIAVTETLFLFGISFVWFDGALLANAVQSIGVLGTLLLFNGALFLPERRYVGIVTRFESKKQHLLRVGMTLHAMAIAAFLVPALLKIYRMP